MAYDYDIICIGMGPAGMAVSAMASAMGLKVCGIERNKVGGECMNVGCIPSKSLLKMAQRRHTAARLLEGIEGSAAVLAAVPPPFERVRKHVDFIGENKTMGMFDKVDLVIGQGPARFTGRRQVRVGERTISARRIFICTGTRPMLPPIPGLSEADPLTNETMFSLDAVPPSLVVLGGGAIAVEMAQAFARLGSAVTIIIRGERLMRRVVAKDATDVLEHCLESEGITIRRNTEVHRVEEDPEGGHRLHLSTDEVISSSRILVALGRTFDLQGLGLEEAGVRYDDKAGIGVDRYLRTSNKAVLAVGDINGFAQFSHAAMHQGMIALMNCMMPWPLRRNYRRFVVPWTMFTQPQVSHVGPTEDQLRERRIAFETITVRYGDYGAAIAEEVPQGYATVYTNARGRVFAVTIVGEGSGNMINEWALVVQKRLRLPSVLLLQHSFPTMGFLSKRLAEQWMMKRMENGFLRGLARRCFRMISW